jgi:hypothetical protein
MPTTNLRRRETNQGGVSKGGNDVALEEICVELLRTKSKIVTLVEPLLGIHMKSHLASARIDPCSAAKI